MNEELRNSIVRIHINRTPYSAGTPMTGEGLYALGNIPRHEKLFREVSGDHEDEPVIRDEEIVELAPDDHFYSAVVMTILVNGDEHEVTIEFIKYNQVVDLFLGSGGASSNEYLIKYSHGPAANAGGTLAPGQEVRIKDGMRFRVAGTGES